MDLSFPIPVIDKDCGSLSLTQSKGRAAHWAWPKPPNPDEKKTFKTATGRRVPLTALLGQMRVIADKNDGQKSVAHPAKNVILNTFSA